MRHLLARCVGHDMDVAVCGAGTALLYVHLAEEQGEALPWTDGLTGEGGSDRAYCDTAVEAATG
jgi:hypothetical protein